MNKNETVYLDYPSKMEFTLFYREDKLQTIFFTWNKEKIEFESVVIGPRCKLKLYRCLVFTFMWNFWFDFKTKINANYV